ncbi:uroporphyrinogen-III C-methyltransferase [Winogradskya consettensis]|uniref:Uroporphyrinogen-III C-methyltransferase n=1 Tax=Winogradskya consettensis TaxID=113560 RepID=A0A919SI10_9ACTN|nr:uroporphyrinogen-III C-methyltransferase [Actinoplanes consettensis]GIM72059.1 uroporphyrinogen-III C-methyltransferase [Actinoplanes consettensis]
MNLYPLALKLDGRRVLVVGGGAVATRRVPALLAAGALVDIVSPVLTPALLAHADAGRLTWQERRFEPSDVDGAWLVHVAVDDPEAAGQVTLAAEQRRVFCVRADDRTAATAWTPAVARQGEVTVAVTDSGDRQRAMAVRDLVAAAIQDIPEAGPHAAQPGQVVLVGSGPGDAELITVKGRRLLNRADVVVTDRLVPGMLLDELRPEVELVDAAKIPYGPSAAQEEINRILVERAKAGKFVVRLKGGDSFVFGRGGEEVLACAEAGVPVTVVPGVTSSIAAPELAGIPVTHRGVAHEFTVVSGHVPPESELSLVDWAALARLRGTLVIMMGLKNLPRIAERLIAEGRGEKTPAAVVQEGSTSSQRVLRSTLGEVAAATAAAGLRPPAVVVVGDVVNVLG